LTKYPLGKYRSLNSPPKGDSSPLDEEILHQSLLPQKTDISIHLSWSSLREAASWFNFTNDALFGFGRFVVVDLTYNILLDCAL
jgi:hypothetical protein